MLRLLPEAQRQQLVFASSGARVASNSDDDDGPSKPRRKRHQTGRACVVCRRAKTACGVERPCERCIRIGQPQFCVSHVPAASNRKRKDKINAGRPIAASPSVDSISVAPPRAPLPPSDSAESFDQSTNSLTSASSVQSSSSNLNVIAQLHSFSSQLINSAHSPLVPLSQSIFVHTSSSSNSLYSPCEQTSVTTLDSVSSIDPLPPAQLVSVPVGSDPAHDSQSLSPGSFKTEVISEEDEEEEEFREATRQKVLARARFWSDSICKVFSSLDSTVRKGHGDTQLLRGMAWIFYQIYSIAPSYRKAIDEAVGAAVRAKFDKPKPVVATSPQKLKPSASASLAPTPSTESVSAEPAASSSSSQVRSPSLSYVPPLSDIRDNPMSVFLTVVSRDNRRLFDSSYAVGTTACVTREVPPIDLPKLALPLQDRMYGMLNSWRFHPEVQTCVSKYLHHQTPFDLKLNMMTEKVRSSMVPFGVLILPLYPAPFAGYRPWCNQSFALMLGYSHSEALEKCQTIPGFRSFFEDESMNLYNTEQYSVVTRGKTASTMPFTVVTKDGCPVKTILSVSWKYQDLLPLYSVCYFQVVAPIGDMIVFNVAKQ